MAGINFINEEEYSKPLTFKNNDVIHVVVKSLKDRKTTTIDDYIQLFYDKRGDKYFSKGTCLFRDMEEIKQRYNWFLKRTL
jgi:hypothetical protein